MRRQRLSGNSWRPAGSLTLATWRYGMPVMVLRDVQSLQDLRNAGGWRVTAAAAMGKPRALAA